MNFTERQCTDYGNRRLRTCVTARTVIIGINDERIKTFASTASNDEIIALVKVAESMSISSHGALFLYRPKTLVFIYGLSDGNTAAIFSISSVASS